jgi:hypothetical protein
MFGVSVSQGSSQVLADGCVLLQRNDCRKLMRRVMSILELPVRTYIEPMRDTGARIRTKNLKLPLPNAIKKKKIGILSTSVAVGE